MRKGMPQQSNNTRGEVSSVKKYVIIGNGVAAALLAENGIEIFGESRTVELL